MAANESSETAEPAAAATATTTATTTANTMEMAWNPTAAVTDLRLASQILSDRGLKLSAKWCAEQWMGLPPEVVESAAAAAGAAENQSSSSMLDVSSSSCGGCLTTTIADELLLSSSTSAATFDPAVQYSKSVLELGEYGHAAAILSETSLLHTAAAAASVEERMPPPLPHLSPRATYFRAYALYLAGERAREEKLLELESEGQKNVSENSARNPYLSQLSDELLEAYEAGQLDAFGLHVYGMVLMKIKVAPANSPTPQTVLMKSILQFPYNWSAWLDLASLCLDGAGSDGVEHEIEQQLQSVFSGHFVYHFFCAHLQAERHQHAEALQIYERWLDPQLFGGSPYLMSQHAVCSYHVREFAQAKSLLTDLHHHMPYRLDSMDVYSNILYVQEDAVALSQLAHTAVSVDPYRAETCCIVGNYYSLKQQRAKAVQYFQRALAMDRTFTSAWTLMGHEYIEWKQTAHALEAYRRAVAVAPGDYRAWYGLGQTYELLNMNLYALYYYKQAVQLRPYDARMWCALGTSYTHLKQSASAIRAFERALQQDESEGVATSKLAVLYQQKGQLEKAAQCYMRHLEIRFQMNQPGHHQQDSSDPEDLAKKLQSIFLESSDAEAVMHLAKYHNRKGQLDFASAFCTRLLDYPGPEQNEAKALLREIKSKMAIAAARPTMHTRSKGPVQDTFMFSP